MTRSVLRLTAMQLQEEIVEAPCRHRSSLAASSTSKSPICLLARSSLPQILAMRGWRHAAGSANRNAWIEKPIMDDDSTGGIYNIFTNYDQYAPQGITRQVRCLT